MVGGEYVDALVDLQLFHAKVQSGVRLPWLLSVRLEFERKGDVGDTKVWQRRKLLGMMFEGEKRFGSEIVRVWVERARWRRDLIKEHPLLLSVMGIPMRLGF